MDKILLLLGLANRARKVLYGEKAMQAIRAKEAFLVLLAEDSSINTKKKVNDKCATYQIPVKSVESKELLSKAIGKNDIAMVAIIEEGFAKKIMA